MLFPEDLLCNTYLWVSDLSSNKMVAIRRDKGGGEGVPLTTLTMHTDAHRLAHKRTQTCIHRQTQTNTD